MDADADGLCVGDVSFMNVRIKLNVNKDHIERSEYSSPSAEKVTRDRGDSETRESYVKCQRTSQER